MKAGTVEVQGAIIKAVSTRSGVPIQKIGVETKFVDDLGLDSFAMVELLYELELEYGIQLDNSLVRDIRTVGDLVKTLAERISS
jgi:acyl carrier protein